MHVPTRPVVPLGTGHARPDGQLDRRRDQPAAAATPNVDITHVYVTSCAGLCRGADDLYVRRMAGRLGAPAGGVGDSTLCVRRRQRPHRARAWAATATPPPCLRPDGTWVLPPDARSTRGGEGAECSCLCVPSLCTDLPSCCAVGSASHLGPSGYLSASPPTSPAYLSTLATSTKHVWFSWGRAAWSVKRTMGAVRQGDTYWTGATLRGGMALLFFPRPAGARR